MVVVVIVWWSTGMFLFSQTLTQLHPPHPPSHTRQQAFVVMANGAEGGGGGGQRLLDVSNLSREEAKEWRRFNVVLDGQTTAENTKKKLVPFQCLHDFVVFKGRSGNTMSWPQSKPSHLPYTGTKLRVEGELRRMATMVSGRQIEKTMRVVVDVRRFTVDVRSGEQRGIWIEANEAWFLLREPRPDFASMDSFRSYRNWYNKVSFVGLCMWCDCRLKERDDGLVLLLLVWLLLGREGGVGRRRQRVRGEGRWMLGAGEMSEWTAFGASNVSYCM